MKSFVILYEKIDIKTIHKTTDFNSEVSNTPRTRLGLVAYFFIPAPRFDVICMCATRVHKHQQNRFDVVFQIEEYTSFKLVSKRYYFVPPVRLSEALIYAAEAYHTRGAIRHVVGALQMRWIDSSLRTPLSTNDLWVSMIENWGEANKEYNHCKGETLVQCFMKMSKYMWRVFDAMRLLRPRLPKRSNLLSFGHSRDPQYMMGMWKQYKKEERTVFTRRQMEDVAFFLKQFKCYKEAFRDLRNIKFSLDCLGKLNEEVNAYNVKLAALFGKKSFWGFGK